MAGLKQNYRDELTASSSRPHEDGHALQNYEPKTFQEVLILAGADATIRALFATINQTNYLIFSQGERLRALK